MFDWHDFFVATASAAAALTGLIFVGVSISLPKILATPTLPNRALISLILLLTILILSLLCLVPRQSFGMLGKEVLVLCFIVWIMVSKMDIVIFKNKEKEYKKLYVFNMCMDQLAVLPYFIGAILILTSGEAGLYWIVLALVFSFIKAVLDAWVLLVEINR